MLKIAIYGKGGIGKSTTTSNLSAALSDMGYHIMQIGCDPKSDSTKNLMGGRKIPTVLDQIREKGPESVELSDIVFAGYGGVLCVEAGGPTPGIGCAGRGIITAFEKLEALGAYARYEPDIVLYDVLGDVVCGGFAMPIRGGYADHVLIVTSGEMMALYAASNIASAIHNFGRRGYAQFSGLILNARNVEAEQEIVEKAAQETAEVGSGSSSSGSSGKKPSGGSSGSSGSGISVSGDSSTGVAIANYALQFVGNPYVYGGTSLTNGADCSGFTMSVFAHFGISLPHSSAGQRSVGRAVSYSEAQAGDLICYDGHVAIYLGGGRIVHASTEKTGIKTGTATYRTILSVRRCY